MRGRGRGGVREREGRKGRQGGGDREGETGRGRQRGGEREGERERGSEGEGGERGGDRTGRDRREQIPHVVPKVSAHLWEQKDWFLQCPVLRGRLELSQHGTWAGGHCLAMT